MSEYSLKYHPAADDEINDLDKSLKERIRKSLTRLQKKPLEGKPLKGELSGFRSSRVGNYRIVYTISNDQKIVYVLYVGHRSEVYQEAKRKL
jgi:mRNA interferase RelE/StbE